MDRAFAGARTHIAYFAPDLVVLFAPDHYNGFFYDMMPPFCMASPQRLSATTTRPQANAGGPGRGASTYPWRADPWHWRGDLGTHALDHGFAQPLQFLVGGLTEVAVVPPS